MAATGCASAVVTCRCIPARRRREPQVLPAYGLQDLRKEPRDPKTKSNPNTMCLQTTPGEDYGSGHFYLAKNRTFLLCVDTRELVRGKRLLRRWFASIRQSLSAGAGG